MRSVHINDGEREKQGNHKFAKIYGVVDLSSIVHTG